MVTGIIGKKVGMTQIFASDGTVQVQTGRGLRRRPEQHGGLLRHVVDHAQLAVAEGVALVMGLLPEVVADRLGAGAMAGTGKVSVAEQTA